LVLAEGTVRQIGYFAKFLKKLGGRAKARTGMSFGLQY
jgi:hypothetical protein